MDHETLGGRIPKGERRVRFADSMGMELVSIFLTDLFVLASHTPYTNYHENRKPPSSRLSSTLQAIQYNHDHYHNHSSNNRNNINADDGDRSSISKSPATNSSKQLINNNHYNHSYSSHHSNNQHAKLTHKHQPSAATLKPAPPSPLPASSPSTEFICEFTQPVSLISFKERVKRKKVHLENCYINTTAGHVSLTCNIRVFNVSYDKSVSVRYTTDDWGSHTDSLASYKPGSSDGWSDQFTSTISIINKLQPGQRVIFAVRYASGGSTYWDNNGGLNYSVKSKSDSSN